MNKNDVLFLLVALFIMYYLTQQASGYQVQKPSGYQVIGGLGPDANWSRGVYSPELGIWVSTGAPFGPNTQAVSAYSYDGKKWIMNTSESGGLPVQYGPQYQNGWKSVAYGNTANGPLFVAVSDGYDNWIAQSNAHNYYVDGQLTNPSNYVSVATSTDGINWITGTGLFPYSVWNIIYDKTSNYFQCVGDVEDGHQNIYNSYGAQSQDGINWQMTNLPFAITECNDLCYGSHGVVTAGVWDGPPPQTVTALLPSTTTIWNTTSNMPSNENITSVEFLQGAYYAVGQYGLYESTDGLNWTNLNPTDSFGNTLLNWSGSSWGWPSGSNLNGDIQYFKGHFVLHISNIVWNTNQITMVSGQFYYSQNAQGPYELGIYGNIPVDDYVIQLSTADNPHGGNDILIGLGYSATGQTCPLYSDDGIMWNKV